MAVDVRELSSIEDMAAAAALIDRIWGEERVVMPALLRALATHGGEVLGAYRGTELVGAQVAFLGTRDGRLVLHSHITGVAPGQQGAGVGYALKRGQREWCLARGIDTVTWTFDPLVARNAHFNLQKLGAVADRFHRDFYGDMPDAINAGDRSDRLEVSWELRSPRVEAALRGELAEPDAEGVPAAVDERDGLPVSRPLPEEGPVLVAVPPDYHALRRREPDAAAAWRSAVADALEAATARGHAATGFVRGRGYVLEPAAPAP
ncbi:MAG TPA: GNAT family N-acetyltransferase [Actinomycetota bacterium]|nr:GNAT family N-acetyltransferase [Actinomycetota bacterium]